MPHPDFARSLFCNRTLNLRAIRAVGYDMDYTLIHYSMKAWERRAYAYIKERLLSDGWPVGDLEFDPNLVMRGLIIDKEMGNVVKANRFGYIKRGYHGTRCLPHDELRDTYRRTLVDLNESRWHFLNTLFAISEAGMYMQLVDLLDRDELKGSMGYGDLHTLVRRALDEAHMEGRLKGEIINEPERFVDLDEEMPLTLLDQKEAGKKVLLITNSEWAYAEPMLDYAFDRFLPGNLTWHDLFDLVIVGARKPDFFMTNAPAFEVVDENGLLREHRGHLQSGRVYVGGNASLVEQSLDLRGEQILYVGDHLFTDVNVVKNVLRWRTALVVRELEDEIAEMEDFRDQQDRLERMMARKEAMELEYSQMRLELQRNQGGYGPQTDRTADELEHDMKELRERLVKLDDRIAPLARAASALLNPKWGPLMRAGKDKSHFARQVERYADIYTGRVSNFLHTTPFEYLRSHRGSLPHDAPLRVPHEEMHPVHGPTERDV